jgi:predicted permease
LEATFVQRRDDAARERGWVGAAGVWSRAVPAVLANGIAERLSRASEKDPQHPADAGGRSKVVARHGTGGAGMFGSEFLRAARGLIRAPRYTVATVVTFGLVIGASTLFFAVVDGVIFRPLAYPDSRDLAFVGYATDHGPASTAIYSLDRLEEGVSSLDGITYFSTYVTILTGVGDPVRLAQATTSSDYFDVLGVKPAVGRGFRPEEEGPGAPAVAVISDRLWRTRFQSDPAVVGRTATFDAQPHEIVGVMPPGFRGPDDLFRDGEARTDVWMPSTADPVAQGPGYWTVRGVARLAPGAPLARVAQEARNVAAGIRGEYPDAFPESGFALVPLRDMFLNAQGRRIVLLLSLGVGLVLLVGCANVANLAVARGLAREEARAVRVALGAGRRHLITEVVAEVLVVGLLGGAAGLVVAAFTVHGFLAAAPPLALLDGIRIDGTVALGAGALTLLATLLGALIPSLEVAARAPGALMSQARGGSSRRRMRAQQIFAGFQVAAAIALLGGSLLVHDSIRSLLSVNPGFRAEGVRVAQMDLPAERYPDVADRLRFTREATAALVGRAGIQRVAFVTSAPQVGRNNFSTRVSIDGKDPEAGATPPMGFFRAVTPGYLDAMGVRVRRGRALGEEDVADGTPAGALVNEEFVRRWLASGDPAGHTLTVFGQSGIPIVGVVENVRYGSLGNDPVPEIYLPFVGRFNAVFLVARSAGDPAEVTRAMRDGIHAIDPSMPMNDIAAMPDLVRESMRSEIFLRLLVACLAGLALALATVGTYAVLAEAVARRSREMGIRVALGARRSSLRRMVLVRGLRMVAGGLVVGLGAAYLAGRGLQGALYGVHASSPEPYVISAVLMAAVGLLAAWMPARKAMLADPLTVLREE